MNVKRVESESEWDSGHIPLPRFYFSSDSWTDGSSIAFGFEIASQWADPVLRIGLRIVAKPDALLDKIFVRIAKRQWGLKG